MTVESILGSPELGTKIPHVGRRRRTPLSTAIIFTVVVDGVFAARTVPGYFILEKLDRISADLADHIKNGLRPPFLSIVAGTFTHVLTCLGF